MRISVFGLGKLGAAIAAVIASKGHQVVGVDVSSRAVELMNRSAPPVEETGLADLIAKVGANLRATTDGQEAVAATDLSILIVPTPSEASGRFALDIILQAAQTVGRALRAKGSYHTVVVSSTVLPGATEGEIIPAIETASGKRCGVDFGVVYSPEFVALGAVIHDMRNPDIVLIGANDVRAGDAHESFMRSVVDNQPAYLRMNIVNAEVTKLAVNTYVTTKISFANMLAEICEKLPNADAHVVTAAIGRDSRIGSKFIRPGAAYGGPCFPRDNKALSYLASSLGARALLAESTDRVNLSQTERLAEMTMRDLPPAANVGILGLSYKPETSVIEEAAGLHLAQALAARRVPVIVYDPVALEPARAVLGNSVSYAPSAQRCIEDSHTVVLATAWNPFKGLAFGAGRNRVLVDCWRMIDPGTLAPQVDYHALGMGTVTARREGGRSEKKVAAEISADSRR